MGENTLTASEAIFAFCGWLTSRETKTVMSSSNDSAPIAQLVGAFCDANKLDDPREDYHHLIKQVENIHPK